MTAEQPSVSIILPVFNGEAHIESALRKIEEHAFKDFELIVVDDCSTDGTDLKLQAFIPTFKILTLRLSQNQGVAAARNFALKHAQGEYVWFIDVDDDWSPNFLPIMHRAAVDADADMAICGAEFLFGPNLSSKEDIVRFNRTQELSGAELVTCILLGSGALWNKLIRRSVLGTTPFPLLRSKSDHGGVLTILPRLKTMVTVPEVLYTYIQRDGSISNGGIPQPQNFLSLLPIAEASLSSIALAKKTRVLLTASFRCEIIGRALRECWRYQETNSRLGKELVRQLSWRDIVNSTPADRRTRITCFSAKLSPTLARSAFRFLGRKRWSTVSQHHNTAK